MVPPEVVTTPTPNAGLPPRGDSTLSHSSHGSTVPAFPRPPVPPPPTNTAASRETSTTSQLTVDTFVEDELVNTNNATSLPRPAPFSEARDVSASSRDSLRRKLLQRASSLTTQEQRFLSSLCDNGDEVEVQLAMETLQDDDLFFDYTTPRHLKHHPPPAPGEEDEEADDATRQSPSPPSIKALDRQLSVGSARRNQILEKRRSSSSIQFQMWRAHEGGIAVTTSGSRRSISLRRESSTGSSTASGLRRSAELVFRDPPAGPLPPPGPQQSSMKKKPVYRRSQSLIYSRPPPIPTPEGLVRDSTNSSGRKSVTFTGLEESQRTASSSSSRRRSKPLRRTVSDGVQYALAKALEADAEEQQRRQQRGIMDRQESTGSIPSIHIAHPIRQESISSIPSLHHGLPIRQESVTSIPSLHHGHPIRQESITSIPSLHHGHPIRSESFPIQPNPASRSGSIRSIPSLHHGNSICSNSIAASNSIVSIPSLHHGHPLHDDDSRYGIGIRRRTSIDSLPQDANLVLAPQNYYYSATDDIATKWLMQQRKDTGARSLPDSVTIPITDTKTTEAETVSVSEIPAAAAAAAADVANPADSDEDTPPRCNSSCASPITNKSVSDSSPMLKPVLMRLASQNNYQGQGVEVTEIEDNPTMMGTHSRRASYVSMLSMDASIRTASSWDESSRCFSHSEIFRSIHRSLSDDDMANMFLGSSAANLVLKDSSAHSYRRKMYCEQKYDDDDDETSWDMNSDNDGRFDSWNILKDDYINGYGGGGTLGFSILGTSAEDESAQPHVLSPPLMESLQAFLPYSKSGENFFLKYSMVRDGASLHSFLKRVRGIEYSILAVETLDGEVFGAFTACPWRKNWNYFGTGESFLWRMRRTRLEKTGGILEQAQLESEIDVYPYTGENKFIQLCTHDRIAVGGGNPASSMMGEKKSEDDPADVQAYQWGFGLAIEHDFLQGSSSPCITFGSPSLSNVHSDGSTFEIVNMELWTLTPCQTVEEAEKLELGKLFLERKK